MIERVQAFLEKKIHNEANKGKQRMSTPLKFRHRNGGKYRLLQQEPKFLNSHAAKPQGQKQSRAHKSQMHSRVREKAVVGNGIY